MNSEEVLSYQSQFGLSRQLLYKKNGGKKKLLIRHAFMNSIRMVMILGGEKT
jgi:hypothetical protein